MVQPTLLWDGRAETDLVRERSPLPRERLAAGGKPLEIELGFGKGRFLLGRAEAREDQAFLGIEVASKYYRLARGRAARRGLSNLTLIRGEAIFLMSTTLAPGLASVVHVYHPDPWPKDRHHKRRLFDPETVDLVIGLLEPGGRLCFGTDFLDYGELVSELLASHPGVDVVGVDAWPEGPRTNYEAKFVALGQPIVRLIATRRSAAAGDLIHPAGRRGILAGPREAG